VLLPPRQAPALYYLSGRYSFSKPVFVWMAFGKAPSNATIVPPEKKRQSNKKNLRFQLKTADTPGNENGDESV